MTAFIIVCVAMLLAALLWMLVPLFRTPKAAQNGDATAYRNERRISGGVVAVLVPALAVLMYAGLSNWDWKAVQVEQQQAASLDDAIKTLEAKLAAHPDNLQGWMMLGRSYTALERFPRAVDAYEQAYKLSKGRNVDAVIELGLALAMTDEVSISGRAGKLFDEALVLAPNNPKALWYGGIAAVRNGDLRTGRDRLRLLLAQNPPEEIRGTLERQVQDLSEQLGEGGAAEGGAAPPAVVANQPAPAAAGGSRAIQVSASLSPQLRQQLSGPVTLFILARDAAAAGGPPLAVQRHSSNDLPLTVQLTEQDAMLPSRTLASVDKVVVVARLSRSGAPQQQSGDLYGEAEYEFGKTSGPLSIIIDQAVP